MNDKQTEVFGEIKRNFIRKLVGSYLKSQQFNNRNSAKKPNELGATSRPFRVSVTEFSSSRLRQNAAREG